MKSKILILAFFMFCIIGASYAQKPPLIPWEDVPENPDLPSDEESFQNEYNYGYLQGKSYAVISDYATYQHFLEEYTQLRNLYPEDNDFYSARILGLTYGYSENRVHPDFTVYNGILQRLQQSITGQWWFVYYGEVLVGVSYVQP